MRNLEVSNAPLLFRPHATYDHDAEDGAEPFGAFGQVYDFSRSEPPWLTLACLDQPEPPEKCFPNPNPKALVNVKIDKETYEAADDILKQAFDSLIKTNIVCTARLSMRKPIEEIAWHLGGMYDRSVFPSCMGSSHEPKASWNSFRQGYIRCAGGNTREKAQYLIYALAYRLYVDMRMPFRIYNFSVQNYVSAVTIPYPINLDKLQRMDDTRYKYEPDLFPGLIYRMLHPKLVVQIFDSGKWNLVGAKDIRDPIAAIRILEPVVRQCRIYSFQLNTTLTLDDLYSRDSSDSLHHPLVVGCEKDRRKNKKTEKFLKDSSKKRKQERKSLKDRASELDRTAKKMKRTDGKALSRSSMLSADLSLVEQDLLMIQERLDELPVDDSGIEEEKTTLLLYELQGAQRTYHVELMHDKQVNVLDADNEEQFQEALKICHAVFC